MIDKKLVSISTMDGIASIIINRPEKHNALDGYLVQELLNAFRKLSNENGIGVVILRSYGEHFCAGADIVWMQKMALGHPDENLQDANLLADLLYCIHTFPKPVIVLTQGSTLGGGLGLIAAADVVVAATNGNFCFSEVKIGIAPFIVSPYIIAAIGERTARYYFLTAARFDAIEAQRLGLVHHVVDVEALANTGLNIAHELMKHSPAALAAAKKLTRFVAHEKITQEFIEVTAKNLATMRESADAREGLRSFIEKRVPKWAEPME